MKYCTVCKRHRELCWFRVRYRKDCPNLGSSNQCTDCEHLQIKLRPYGLSIPQFKQMVEEQNGLCFICKRPPGVKGLCIDHCHSSGKIRKLLCTSCNTLLGHCKEDVSVLQAAIDYLKGHQ